MGIKSFLLRPVASYIRNQIRKHASTAETDQQKILETLVRKAAPTHFGKIHHFGDIQEYTDFRQAVPLADYEDLRPYIEQVIAGEEGVLWPGRPKYFAKTSGTTSGVKYIPMSKESTPAHFATARNALFNYAACTGNFSFLDGKMIFLSGSPEMDETGGIPTGRLSGISNHLVPGWLRSNQLPSYEVNCLEDWEEKLERIVEETWQQDLRLISGIPPWVQMYYERLLQKSGKPNIKALFPHFSVFVYGGVNFEPYRSALEKLTGPGVDSVETYPASEGFIAFQDTFPHQGLLLNTRAGLFFEFIPHEEVFSSSPTRLMLSQVEKGQVYAVVLNSNAGLWGYQLGDTVEFITTRPYRVRVAGRVKHFISAFGEHVIGKEVEEALQQTAEKYKLEVVEFTVAPQVTPPAGGAPFHEWFIEFGQAPADLSTFSRQLDEAMVEQNIYYQDLIKGGILKPLEVRVVRPGGFREFMKARGKLGGQNKVPRLSNDRQIARELQPFCKQV